MTDTEHVNASRQRLTPPGTLSVSSRREGTAHAIVVHGELDVSCAPELEAEILRVEGSDAQSIVLDLSALQFVDSSGLRVILAAADRERDGAGRLRVVRGEGPVRRLFALTGTEELVPFAD